MARLLQTLKAFARAGPAGTCHLGRVQVVSAHQRCLERRSQSASTVHAAEAHRRHTYEVYRQRGGSMEYAIPAPGFEGRGLMLRTQGWLSGARMWVDGQPAPKGGRRGQYRLRRNDGKDVLAELRPRAAGLDPVPDVVIDGEIVQLAPPLRWYEWVWIFLPLLLLVVGGAIGAGLGGAAAFQNAHIFRSRRSLAARYALTGGLSLAAAVAYVVVAGVIGAVF